MNERICASNPDSWDEGVGFLHQLQANEAGYAAGYKAGYAAGYKAALGDLQRVEETHARIKLARDLYYAINDAYEDVEKHVDADLIGDAYRSNWAGNAIERWKPLLERAQKVLGL